MKKTLISATLVSSILLILHAQPQSTARVADKTGVQPPGKNEVSFRIQGDKRVVDSNGIPDHLVGHFPGRGNPNTISAQKYHREMPLNPKIADKSVHGMGTDYGVAVNGVMFDPGTAEFWKNDRNSGWHYEAGTGKLDLGLDLSNGHVQPTGAYHYHAIPLELLKKLNPDNKARPTHIGYAADGFAIYARWDYADPKNAKSEVRVMRSSYKLKQGQRPGGPGGAYDGTFTEDFEYIAGSGDLDECGGRFAVTPENPEGIYHYLLTDDYPFIPRLYKGTPDPSFRKGPPGGGGGRGPGGRPQGGPPGGGFPPPPFGQR